MPQKSTKNQITDQASPAQEGALLDSEQPTDFITVHILGLGVLDADRQQFICSVLFYFLACYMYLQRQTDVDTL